MLKAGQEAPNFSLPDQNDNSVSLLDFRGKKNVIIFFYPKDNTPGCTAQSCSFRDNYSAFNELNTQVIGVSQDSVESHKDFSQRNQLSYPILCDADGSVRKLYGLKKLFGLIPDRVSFAINKNGIIQHVFCSQFQSTKHIEEMLNACRKITN